MNPVGTGAKGVAGPVPESGLRFGLSPAFLYRRDAGSGQLTGFGIDLAADLAGSLGARHRFVEYRDPEALVEGLTAGTCDLAAIIGIDPRRATEVDFSPPYLRADYTFLVPASSSVRSMAELDRTGTRVAVVRNHRMDSVLRGQLHEAESVYTETPDESFDKLRCGVVDAAAGIRPGLLRYAARLEGSRVLNDAFGENRLAMAVAKGNGSLLARVDDYLRGARASGHLRRMAERCGLPGEWVDGAA